MTNHTVYVDPEIGAFVNGRPINTHWLVVERDEDLKTVRRQSVAGLEAAYALANQWRLEIGSLAPKQCVGQRVLVTVGDNDAARMTCILHTSPNGLYCFLDGDSVLDANIGWVRCDSVKVLDVFGDSSEPISRQLTKTA